MGGGMGGVVILGGGGVMEGMRVMRGLGEGVGGVMWRRVKRNMR